MGGALNAGGSVCAFGAAEVLMELWAYLNPQNSLENGFDPQTTHKNGRSPTIILGVKPIFKLEF